MKNAVGWLTCLIVAFLYFFGTPPEVSQPVKKVFRQFSDSYYRRFPDDGTSSREQRDQEFYEKLDRKYHWDWEGMTDEQKRGQVFNDNWLRKSQAKRIEDHGSEQAYYDYREQQQNEREKQKKD